MHEKHEKYRNQNKEAGNREIYILSLISSNRFISFLANCCLLYSGATVTAVT